MDQFLGHHRTAVTAAKARKTLHEEYGPLVSASPSPFDFVGEITKSARNYVRVQQNELGSIGAKRALRSLHRVEFEEWIPPLLAFLNAPVTGMSEDEFITLFERITYQNWVRRLAFTARLTVYFQLINAIRAGASAQEVRAIFRQNGRDAEFAALLDGEVYGKPFAGAVLLRIEEADQDDSVTKDYGGKITIEHVLPQAMKDDYWRARFTEEAHRLWLHRLGNIALLAGTKNYRAQYFAFDRKKAIYRERNNKVSFDTTKCILDEPEWGPAAIGARHGVMMESAIRLWGLG